MTDQNNCCSNNPEITQYFNTLPKMVQESIKQSGTQIQSLEELKQIAQQMTQQQ